MFLSKKIIVCLLLWSGVAGLIWAQRNMINPDGFIGRLRAGGQAYMVPNLRVGQEALSAGMRSSVGRVPLTTKDKFKYKAYEISQKHLSPAMLERLVENQFVRIPFPAYYMDFEKAWEQAKEKTQINLRHLEVILEAAYGEETEFEGEFIPSYREVLDKLKRKEQGMMAWGALKQAFTQGRQKKSGFFVITVHETQEHGQDVLLLDLKNIQFISVSKSIGEAWLEHTVPLENK